MAEKRTLRIHGGTISAIQWTCGGSRPVREITSETTENGQSGCKNVANGASVLNVVSDAKAALPRQASDTVWDPGARETEGVWSWQQV